MPPPPVCGFGSTWQLLWHSILCSFLGASQIPNPFFYPPKPSRLLLPLQLEGRRGGRKHVGFCVFHSVQMGAGNQALKPTSPSPSRPAPPPRPPPRAPCKPPGQLGAQHLLPPRLCRDWGTEHLAVGHQATAGIRCQVLRAGAVVWWSVLSLCISTASEPLSPQQPPFIFRPVWPRGCDCK